MDDFRSLSKQLDGILSVVGDQDDWRSLYTLSSNATPSMQVPSHPPPRSPERGGNFTEMAPSIFSSSSTSSIKITESFSQESSSLTQPPTGPNLSTTSSSVPSSLFTSDSGAVMTNSGISSSHLSTGSSHFADTAAPHDNLLVTAVSAPPMPLSPEPSKSPPVLNVHRGIAPSGADRVPGGGGGQSVVDQGLAGHRIQHRQQQQQQHAANEHDHAYEEQQQWIQQQQQQHALMYDGNQGHAQQAGAPHHNGHGHLNQEQRHGGGASYLNLHQHHNDVRGGSSSEMDDWEAEELAQYNPPSMSAGSMDKSLEMDPTHRALLAAQQQQQHGGVWDVLPVPSATSRAHVGASVVQGYGGGGGEEEERRRRQDKAQKLIEQHKRQMREVMLQQEQQRLAAQAIERRSKKLQKKKEKLLMMQKHQKQLDAAAAGLRINLDSQPSSPKSSEVSGILKPGSPCSPRKAQGQAENNRRVSFGLPLGDVEQSNGGGSVRSPLQQSAAANVPYDQAGGHYGYPDYAGVVAYPDTQQQQGQHLSREEVELTALAEMRMQEAASRRPGQGHGQASAAAVHDVMPYSAPRGPGDYSSQLQPTVHHQQMHASQQQAHQYAPSEQAHQYAPSEQAHQYAPSRPPTVPVQLPPGQMWGGGGAELGILPLFPTSRQANVVTYPPDSPAEASPEPATWTSPQEMLFGVGVNSSPSTGRGDEDDVELYTDIPTPTAAATVVADSRGGGDNFELQGVLHETETLTPVPGGLDQHIFQI